MFKTTVHIWSSGVDRYYQTEVKLIASSLKRKKDPGAKFGATLANVGDLDGDGYKEFAVGAPFENGGEGAVYIYRGAESGIKEGKIDNYYRVTH